jgi:ATP synthase proteolipid subunit
MHITSIFKLISPSTLKYRANDSQPFFGAMGCAIAMVLTAVGASYGMAKSGIGVMATGILRPDKVMQSKLGFHCCPKIILAIYSNDVMMC